MRAHRTAFCMDQFQLVTRLPTPVSFLCAHACNRAIERKQQQNAQRHDSIFICVVFHTFHFECCLRLCRLLHFCLCFDSQFDHLHRGHGYLPHLPPAVRYLYVAIVWSLLFLYFVFCRFQRNNDDKIFSQKHLTNDDNAMRSLSIRSTSIDCSQLEQCCVYFWAILIRTHWRRVHLTMNIFQKRQNMRTLYSGSNKNASSVDDLCVFSCEFHMNRWIKPPV